MCAPDLLRRRPLVAMPGDAAPADRNARRRCERRQGRPGFQRQRLGENRQRSAVRAIVRAPARRRVHGAAQLIDLHRPLAASENASTEFSPLVGVRSTGDGVVEGAERRRT